MAERAPLGPPEGSLLINHYLINKFLLKIKNVFIKSGEKWLKDEWSNNYIVYSFNYNHIYGPLENIDISVLVIFINFEQFWPKR